MTEELPDNGGDVHWYWPSQLTLCDDYVMGDSVIDEGRERVTCQECLELLHS